MRVKEFKESLKGKSQAEIDQYVSQLFRQVFNTPLGRIVLAYILDDLCWHNVPKDADDIALRNYATRLLRERLKIRDIIASAEALMNIADKE